MSIFDGGKIACISLFDALFEGIKMEAIYLLIGLFIIVLIALFFFMEHRWKRAVEEGKADQSSQTTWTLMQQQMEQLRGQMSDGLNKNISLAFPMQPSCHL